MNSETNLLTELNEKASHLLADAGIYSVLDYAWEGEDEPSGVYIGLAMWCLDAPFKPSWQLWDRSAPPKKPSLQDETFYKAGEDFIGTMEIARKAMGLVLYSFQFRKSDNIMEDNENFWEQHGVAAVWLNAASDRIRDYFVMARHGMTSKEYKKGGTGRKNYTHPFLFPDSNESPNAKTAAERIAQDAKELDRRRTLRNKMIHEVTSRQGRRAVESICRQRKRPQRVPTRREGHLTSFTTQTAGTKRLPLYKNNEPARYKRRFMI